MFDCGCCECEAYVGIRCLFRHWLAISYCGTYIHPDTTAVAIVMDDDDVGVWCVVVDEIVNICRAKYWFASSTIRIIIYIW
jgi:hypothetical protein